MTERLAPEAAIARHVSSLQGKYSELKIKRRRWLQFIGFGEVFDCLAPSALPGKSAGSPRIELRALRFLLHQGSKLFDELRTTCALLPREPNPHLDWRAAVGILTFDGHHIPPLYECGPSNFRTWNKNLGVAPVRRRSGLGAIEKYSSVMVAANQEN